MDSRSKSNSEEKDTSPSSRSYPPELAPSAELLEEIKLQKGAGITIRYEKESDLYFFTPKKFTKEQRTGSLHSHPSALFSVSKSAEPATSSSINDKSTAMTPPEPLSTTKPAYS